MTSDNARHRLGLLAVAALSLFGALFARLWFLQVVDGETLKAAADTSATKPVIIPAARGRILDRNGVVLVDNRESIVLGIDTQQYDALKPATQTIVLKRLANTLSEGKIPANRVSVKDLKKKLNDSRYSHFRPVPVAEDISEQDEIYYSEQASRFPSVVVERSTVRDYPYGSLAAHVLGYVGPLSDPQWKAFDKKNDPTKPYVQTDEIGQSGVEAHYEKYLRGTPGREVFEVDRAGKPVREIESDRVEPKVGDDLYLSIDARVQYKAEVALQAQLINKFEGRPGQQAGGLVVMDQSTGQVRAMASYPTYDPSELVGGISCPTWRDLQGLPREGSCRGRKMAAEIAQDKADDKPPVPKLLNRALQGAYYPASTFKLASSYAALKDHLRTPETSIADGGSVDLCHNGTTGLGCVKHNAGNTGHGSVNLSKALTVSSDVYFYEVGRDFWASRAKLGETAFQDRVGELGYGSKTGIDLPAESKGLIPTPKNEAQLALALFKIDPGYYGNDVATARENGRWSTGKSADMAIGQKLSATPLQTANAYASLANGGTLYHPSVLEKVTAAGQPSKIHKRYQKSVIRTIDWGPARESLLTGFRGAVDPTGQSSEGTAVGAFQGFPFGQMPLGGKTGTAQTGTYKNNVKRPDNSVFVAFSLGGSSNWVATATLEYSGSGAGAAAPAVRMVLEPIADGSIYGFKIPKHGRIDAEAAAHAVGPVASGTD